MSDFHFTHHFTYWHIIGYLLITTILLYWEFRKGKSWIRYVISALITFSLLMIYLRPVVEVPKPFQSIVLVGEGVNSEMLDSLFKQKKRPVFEQKMDTASGVSGFMLHASKQKIMLSSWDKQADTIFSVGHIPHMPLHHRYWKILPMTAPYTLQHTRQIKLGDTLKVVVSNTGKRAIDVVIAVDAELPEEKRLMPEENLSAASRKKVSGNYQSSIQVNDSIAFYLNTTVEDNNALLVYLMAGSPDFEWKFLNNFLANKGHAIFWNTKVSKELFKEQVTNWPDSMNKRGIKSKISHYNLLISDVQAWNELSFARQKEIIQAVNEEQLTIIFRANEKTALKDKTGLLAFGIQAGELVEMEDRQYVKNSNTSDWLELNDYQYVNQTAGNSMGLVALQDSYEWILNGQNAEYEHFWGSFINKLLVSSREQYIFNEPLAFEGHPYTINKWASKNENDLSIIDPHADTIIVPSNSQSLMAERTSFVYFPSSVGWHRIMLEDGGSLPFYAHPSSMMKEALGQAYYQYNYHRVLEKQRGKSSGHTALYNQQNANLWFFVLLVLCLSFLWLEEKIRE